MNPLVPPTCSQPCNAGCDLACERPATWKPVVGAALLPTMSDGGRIFRVDADGGGRLYYPRLDDGKPVLLNGEPLAGRKGPRVAVVRGPYYRGR